VAPKQRQHSIDAYVSPAHAKQGVRDEELARVPRELMGGAMLPEEAWERLARLLDLFGVIGALLAMRLAETFDSDPLDELKDLEDVLRAEIGLD
jgi:hypothetical protein